MLIEGASPVGVPPVEILSVIKLCGRPKLTLNCACTFSATNIVATRATAVINFFIFSNLGLKTNLNLTKMCRNVTSGS